MNQRLLLDGWFGRTQFFQTKSDRKAELVALHEVGLVVLDVLCRFMSDFKRELHEPESTYLKPCIVALCTLLKQRQVKKLVLFLLVELCWLLH